MGPDGQPRLFLPRSPGSTVPQCNTSFIGSICALISASFSVGRSFGTPFLWSGCLGWVSPYISILGPETTGVISNRESLSWLQLLLYELIAITPIAHGDWGCTTAACSAHHWSVFSIRSTFPFPFHDTCMRICKRAPPHCAVPMHDWHLTCNAWPQTSRYKHKYLRNAPQIPQVQTRHSWLRSRFSFPFHVHAHAASAWIARAPLEAGSRRPYRLEAWERGQKLACKDQRWPVHPLPL